MNKEFEPIVQKYADEIVRKLIELYDEMGLRASGKFAEDLETQIHDSTKLIILGSKHSGAMESGIRPSNSKYGPVRAIRQWLDDKKNLPPSMLRDKKRVAFAIARKIANEGTKYFQDGGTELISSVITPERIQRIIDKVSKFKVNEFVSDITNAFKEFAPA